MSSVLIDLHLRSSDVFETIFLRLQPLDVTTRYPESSTHTREAWRNPPFRPQVHYGGTNLPFYSASNYDVSKPSQSDASILPDTPSTNSTTTTPFSDISFFSDIYSTSSSDTCSSNTSFSDISETPFSSDASTECNCGSILFDALDSGLGGTPFITKALETVRLYGGYQGLERIVDPVEQLSLCKTCPKEEALREFLYTVCKGVIRQYRHFYYALEEHYETVVYRRSCSSYEREQHDYTFMLYAAKIERIIASVDRIDRVLPEQPVYDGDTWYALANQGDQLADATGRLREQVVFSHG
ncbi:hypothetical protein AbraIFM66951_006771 [Aspergillus brasiliensis]|uniref:Uncharacterized protein n=1 Tax=Aspergillus brasiliensis TaxID=319629 RepID=A0A9W6DSE2_9EURO|nr:hypothetical protein AbraCBS73388_001962 [Aspergillus brasiliensis]GKZ44539.1 hypothetical protein AbraIFM66951_006771 [Aspergillus brasiliensis]